MPRNRSLLEGLLMLSTLPSPTAQSQVLCRIIYQGRMGVCCHAAGALRDNSQLLRDS